MPTYSYKCLDCKNVFDEIKPMKEAGKDSICPECKGTAKRYYAGTTHNFIIDGNMIGANIIDKSPMKNANKGLKDDL